jgi:hypothetical protein
MTSERHNPHQENKPPRTMSCMRSTRHRTTASAGRGLMKLEDIGFYTLSDARAKNVSDHSPMWRCETILTDRCNFKCVYCRGLKADIRGDMPLSQAIKTLNLWLGDGLQNIRFSGGEPTLYQGLPYLVRQCKGIVKRIAISTNGSASVDQYAELIDFGVNDFSFSLDACCAADANKIAGCNVGYEHVLESIRFVASKTYTTVGIVLTSHNVSMVNGLVELSDGLGVSDIRVIPAAQFAKELVPMQGRFLEKYPILRYRIGNLQTGRPVRGLSIMDSKRCHLVKDDSAVAQGYHFPCIIYMREGGNPIGKVGINMRAERMAWSEKTNTHLDRICSQNCLDVCVDYNNKAEQEKCDA